MENLFNLFQFESQKQFDDFMKNIDKKSAIKILELSIINNQQNGLYSLEESYCLYKCISKLKEDENETNN